MGDATLSYLRDHLCPLLIGRDAHQIEDTWQYLYKGAYWRRGPVTMTAIDEQRGAEEWSGITFKVVKSHVAQYIYVGNQLYHLVPSKSRYRFERAPQIWAQGIVGNDSCLACRRQPILTVGTGSSSGRWISNSATTTTSASPIPTW